MVYREEHAAAPQLHPAAHGGSARGWLAQLLRNASQVLDTLAAALALQPQHTSGGEPTLEYHAEAGAPEGALYVNGQLVGHLTGVQRL
jgi:hypothetical protein